MWLASIHDQENAILRVAINKCKSEKTGTECALGNPKISKGKIATHICLAATDSTLKISNIHSTKHPIKIEPPTLLVSSQTRPYSVFCVRGLVLRWQQPKSLFQCNSLS